MRRADLWRRARGGGGVREEKNNLEFFFLWFFLEHVEVMILLVLELVFF